MRTLKLDFLHPEPRPHWSAWLLLGAGLGLVAWSGWQGLAAQRALSEAVAAAPKKAVSAGLRSVRPSATETMTAASQAKNQLSLPWSELFVRLESSRPKKIALLALEADARKPEATVTAEARNAADMLAYVEGLKAEGGFASVSLVSHALREQDPQLPLRFVLRVVWRS